jgi:hypothetical protein
VNPPLRYGFRIVGDTSKRRRLVDAAAAFAGYACCDPRADINCEGYLSVFSYGNDFKTLLQSTGSLRGFTGACWSPFVWFDIDRADHPEQALNDARGLASSILERYRTLDDTALLVFFSGSKGYHIGLPTSWRPAPSATFHLTARRIAEKLAAVAGAVIDTGVYDRVRCFRAPNSRHPRTGLHKRPLALDELLHLSSQGIRKLAEQPLPFDVSPVDADLPQARDDWNDCAREVGREAEAKEQRRAAVACGTATLNRQTLAFIREGAGEGDRHRLLFSAAANLAELGCPPALAHGLLADAALDSGLPPREVHRQIECGLGHVRERAEGNTRV